jgi:starch synthase
VQGVLENYGAYLGERLGAKPPAPRLELPVIPLGVDCDAFAADGPAAAKRAAARARLRLGEGDVAFLFLGRLSYHAKAHPLPMFLALEAAARRCGKPLVLILAGYFFNDSIKRLFLEGARRYCPSVRLVQVEGRKPEARAAAWAAADVFTSFSDNIQESFGLAPVEAMAAGLPVVVSDWDGYRDTVVHGETGFAVPTAMPAPGAGAEFALRYLSGADSYDQYIGRVGLCTAVDVGAAIEAYAALIGDPALRRRMGEAGRARARRLFDWSVIVPAYQALWAELAARRARAGARPGRSFPLRDDPFAVFRAFPTHAIGGATLVERAADEPLREAERIAASAMNNYALAFMLGREELARLFAALEPGRPRPVRELEALFPPARRNALLRALGWLAKGGVLRLAPA